MSTHNAKRRSLEEIQAAISSTSTMGAAALVLDLDRRTFKKLAESFGLYNGGTGMRGGGKFELSNILAGLHPQYPTSKLSKRLVKEGLKKYKCESCGISNWNGNDLTLELNHIDGCSGNHTFENLELLCPNCHSQTETYRSKKLTFRKIGTQGVKRT